MIEPWNMNHISQERYAVCLTLLGHQIPYSDTVRRVPLHDSQRVTGAFNLAAGTRGARSVASSQERKSDYSRLSALDMLHSLLALDYPPRTIG
jgi:hypothetical protein